MKSKVPFALIPLISFALIFSAQAQTVESAAGGDICITRPDLCGGNPLPKKKKKAVRGPASATAAARAAAKAEADLDIEDEFDEMAVEPMMQDRERERPRAARRPQAAALEPGPKALRVTFESYLHSNAAHPAIARRPASMATNQKAFVPPVVRATITGSTLDQPAGVNPAANRGVGDALPSGDGINPGDIPKRDN